MKYIIKVTDDENRIRYYKGFKRSPYSAFGHLADWSFDKSEAHVFNNRDIATKEAHGLNEIAVVVTTQVIEISDNGKEDCILTLEASESKKKTIQLLDDYLEKRYGKIVDVMSGTERTE